MDMNEGRPCWQNQKQPVLAAGATGTAGNFVDPCLSHHISPISRIMRRHLYQLTRNRANGTEKMESRILSGFEHMME